MEQTWLTEEKRQTGPTLCLFLVHGIIGFVSFLKLRTKQKLSEKVNETLRRTACRVNKDLLT